MNKTLKIGLIVLGVAAIATTTFLVIRKKRKTATASAKINRSLTFSK